MEAFLISAVNKFGYLGIAFLIFAENIFPPIPSELILVFGGFMTSRAQLNIVGVIVASTIGSLLGATLLYLIGKVLKKERLKRIVSGKLGRALYIKPEHIDKADRWFVRYRFKAVLICRCVPVVRSLISIPAGISEMKFLPFLALTFLGSAVWNTIFSIVGALCGEAWGTGMVYVEMATTIIVIVAIVLVMVYAILRLRKRNKIK